MKLVTSTNYLKRNLMIIWTEENIISLRKGKKVMKTFFIITKHMSYSLITDIKKQLPPKWFFFFIFMNIFIELPMQLQFQRKSFFTYNEINDESYLYSSKITEKKKKLRETIKYTIVIY